MFVVCLLRNNPQFQYRTLSANANMKTTTFFAFVFVAMTAVLATPVPTSELGCTSSISLLIRATSTDTHSYDLVHRLDAAIFAGVTPAESSDP